MGQVRTQVENFMKKKKSVMPLYFTRSRAEGVVSSLMYGPEAFVQRFLDVVPVLRALKLNLKQGDCMHVVLVLEKNYQKKH